MSDREQELHELRSELEERHSALVKRVTAIESDLRQSDRPRSDDWDDRAQESENDEVLKQLDDHGREELTQIEAALKRMDAGAYGSCAECGDDIAIARLRARPAATRCIECARAGE